MATGASTASVAVLLADVRKGVLAQTRRHAYIAALVGTRRMAVAVNKMDLAGYGREAFERVRDEVLRLDWHLGVDKVVGRRPVPVPGAVRCAGRGGAGRGVPGVRRADRVGVDWEGRGREWRCPPEDGHDAADRLSPPLDAQRPRRRFRLSLAPAEHLDGGRRSSASGAMGTGCIRPAAEAFLTVWQGQLGAEILMKT